MSGGKNTLVRVYFETVWKSMRDNDPMIHAIAEIEVPSPGINSKPKKFIISSNGASGSYGAPSSQEYTKKVEELQIEELKHYLSLLNVDLTYFDLILNRP